VQKWPKKRTKLFIPSYKIVGSILFSKELRNIIEKLLLSIEQYYLTFIYIVISLQDFLPVLRNVALEHYTLSSSNYRYRNMKAIVLR